MGAMMTEKFIEQLEKMLDDARKDFNMASNVQEKMYAKGCIDTILEVISYTKNKKVQE